MKDAKPKEAEYWLGVVGFSNPEAAFALNDVINDLRKRLSFSEKQLAEERRRVRALVDDLHNGYKQSP